MKNMIEKLQFWQQPEYHNYHVGAVAATLKEAAEAIEWKDAEASFWKNRTREALETIKDNVERIAELQQLVARIVEHNDIDSDVPEHIRWEILVADARKALGEKE